MPSLGHQSGSIAFQDLRLTVLPLDKLPKGLGAQVEVNQRSSREAYTLYGSEGRLYINPLPQRDNVCMYVCMFVNVCMYVCECMECCTFSLFMYVCMYVCLFMNAWMDV